MTETTRRRSLLVRSMEFLVSSPSGAYHVKSGLDRRFLCSRGVHRFRWTSLLDMRTNLATGRPSRVMISSFSACRTFSVSGQRCRKSRTVTVFMRCFAKSAVAQFRNKEPLTKAEWLSRIDRWSRDSAIFAGTVTGLRISSFQPDEKKQVAIKMARLFPACR